ncbi:MAG: flagellar motor switch protein FliM [Spirochaetales bacterium]|nr:flagellar motor switch protein FliM [Spirochaetales bacterium]
MTEVLSQNEIDQLFTAMTTGEVVQESSIRSDQKKIKIYDFKHPDKFSKEQMRTLSFIHESFARLTSSSLSVAVNSLVNLNVASVDQLSYEEFLRSIPNPTTLCIINMDPLQGSIFLEIDPSVTFTIIDKLFGGKGENAKQSRELTDIEKAVMEGKIIRILGNVREAWSSVIDVRPRLVHIETNPQFAQVIPSNEMVALITLETRIGDMEGMMNFCIPYITIESIHSKLSTQYMHSSVRSGASTENLLIMGKNLDEVMVTLSAEIGSLNITVRDVLSLQAGDVIRLPGVTPSDSLILKIGNQKKYYCRPGMVGKRVAVQITGKIEDKNKKEKDAPRC